MQRLIYLLFVITLANCQGPQPAATVQFDPEKVPYPHLSDYAFFTGEMKELSPNAGVLPYEPITPLFSDYAYKSRFVWMPKGLQATVNGEGVIEFPDHSVLIKNFYYPADFREPDKGWDMVETRLLVKRRGSWEAFTYVWNEEDTDAELNVVGDFRKVSWTNEAGRARAVEYAVPNKNQCKSCHNRNKELLPIGPRVRYLNKAFSYPDGSAANQLAKWQQAGILAAGSWAEQFAPLPDWDDPQSGTTEERALAYLEVNCGHCHNPEGPAHTTGTYLTSDFQDEKGKLGVCKSPVAAGKGSGGRLFGIAPGQPDSSILVYRMESDDPGVMMPEIGRAAPHEEGIALVREWIERLEGACR
ncbi:MAG: hypothetical protein KDD06_27925, partial [Phaeodactylibacter sp.]|nr:hypothetical protein [Phaeodactylibacter sp.]MCB9286440.1 hypothetical protein [Lewinellaceae bacterium]